MAFESRRPFVGRAAERELIAQLTGRLGWHDLTVLEITGDPGIGKTRLLDLLAERADGPLVRRGRATEFEHTNSFGVFTDAIDDLPLDGTRDRLHRAVRSAVESLATPAGLVLCLDDMHWADLASIELLAYLLRRPPRAPLVVAVSYRARQAPPQLHAALNGRVTMKLDVGPLSHSECALLLGAHVSAALYEESGGNPLYLQALARTGGSGDGHQALLAEFAGLSTAELRFTWAAAVAGDPFDAGLAATAAGMSTSDALACVDTLVSRDLVRASGRSFSFRHPMLRHLAYESADAGWRIGAHTRVAAALTDAPATERARHVECFAQPGDLESVEVLLEGARKVMRSAPSEAAHWLTAAVRLAPERQDLLLDLAEAQCLAGQLHASRATAHLLLGDLTDPAQRARVVAFCAMVERLLGRHAAARALVLRELASGETTALMLELSTGGLMRGSFDENREWARRALESARREGDRPSQATALGFLAMDRYSAGDVAASARLLDEAALLVDGMSDGEFASRLDAALWLGWNEIYFERYQDAVRHLTRALGLANGSLHLLPFLHCCLVSALRWLGRMPEALAHAEEALDLAHLSASAELITMAQASLSWIAVWVGDLPLAIQAGKQAVAAAEDVESWFSALAQAMLARARLASGEREDCVQTILDTFGGPDLPAIDPWNRVSWWEGLVRADLAQGNIDKAWEWVGRIEASAERLGLAGHHALALLSRAQVLAVQGKPAECASLARQAAVEFGKVGCKADAGRSHLLAGMVAADRDQLRQAQVLLGECGAVDLAKLARREQRRLDALSPAPKVADDGVAALTRRQRMVADLVAQGLTNREIARHLDVTTKTVEMHLAQTFAKLGVTSRAAVAAKVSRTQS
ncbi:AAA family ATPase [Actinocrispum sp. NPDC049592]|uniref:ATP-binding protein n=1 Tax=Actinocrispum sp. NPDC049592 TaxID=3154835 RepID=UPI0034274039